MGDPFLDQYIFPGAVIPALSAIAESIERDFILEDFHNFGFDYSLTLEAWDVNSKAFFRENPKAYTPEFQRMWEYYLKMCEARSGSASTSSGSSFCHRGRPRAVAFSDKCNNHTV